MTETTEELIDGHIAALQHCREHSFDGEYERHMLGNWIRSGPPVDGYPTAAFFRLKPAPTTRPWTQADVPPVCWVREKTEVCSRLVMLVGTSGVTACTTFHEYKFLQLYCLHSTDRVTWAKCEVCE